MTDYAERLGQGAVRFRRVLPGPIDRVWSFLTESDKRAQWFCSGVTEPRVGGRIDLVFDHTQLSPLPDDPPPVKHANMPACTSYTGVVTRYEPPRVLAYTWQGDDEASEVCFELEERGDAVHLVLTHTKLRTRQDEVGVSGGWHTHLDILDAVLQGRTPQPFWRRYTVLDREYEARIGERFPAEG